MNARERKQVINSNEQWLFSGLKKPFHSKSTRKFNQKFDALDFDICNKEAARLLGISETTLKLYRERGIIESTKTSPRKYRYSKKNIKKYLLRNYKPALYAFSEEGNKEIDVFEFKLRNEDAEKMLGVVGRTLANYRRERRIDYIQVSSHIHLYSKKRLEHYLSLGYKPSLYSE